jgi:hypothetical protein
MQKIQNITNVTEGDLIILLNDGNTKGIDRVKSLDYQSGKYSYLTKSGKTFDGNLKSFLDQYDEAYIVDEKVFNYTDDVFKKSILDIEWVFENLYGEAVGSVFRSQLIRQSCKNFHKRIQFIDFVKKYSKTIHIVRWGEDEELNYKKEMVQESGIFLKECIELDLKKFNEL